MATGWHGGNCDVNFRNGAKCSCGLADTAATIEAQAVERAAQGARLVRVAEGLLLDTFGPRTNNGDLITAEWGEPDEHGVYTPTFTVHYDDNLVERARPEIEKAAREFAMSTVDFTDPLTQADVALGAQALIDLDLAEATIAALRDRLTRLVAAAEDMDDGITANGWAIDNAKALLTDTAPLAQAHDARIAAEAVAPWIAAMKRVHDSGACGITERDLRGSRCDCGYLQLHGDLLNKRLTQADKPAAVTEPPYIEAIRLSREVNAGYAKDDYPETAVTERRENGE